MSILNRRLALIFTGFTAGVFLYQYSPFLTLFFLFLSLVSLIFLGKRGIILVIASLMFFVGGFYTSLYEKSGYSRTKELAGSETEISGTIISIPETESYGQSAICRTKYGNIHLMTGEPVLRYKDNITFNGRLYYPEEKSRPFAFDYIKYLKSKNIYLLAFATDVNITSNSASLLNPIDALTLLRTTLVNKADNMWSGEPLMFSRAILLGDTSYSSHEFREKLSAGSISHIIAVSGTHVTFVSAMFLLLTSAFSKRKRYLFLSSVPLILAFVILTGASPSSIRAAIMIIFYLIAKSTLSHYDGFTILSLASFAILIVNPFIAFSLSFILSFSAVAGILLFAKPLSLILSRLHAGVITNALSVTLSAQVFTMITLCFSFGRFPLTALIANIAVVPLAPFIMTLGYLALILSFVAPTFNIALYLTELLIKLCLVIADFSGKLPLSNIYPIFNNKVVFIMIFLFFTAMLVAFLVYGAKKTGLVFLSLFLLSAGLNHTLPMIIGEKSFYFVDVGHGDSTFIFNKTTAIMTECLSPEGRFTEDTLLPVLRQHGHGDLDAVFLTEYDPFDEDITHLIESFPVKAIYLPGRSQCRELMEKAKSIGTDIFFVSEGASFTIGEISVKVIHSANGMCSYIIENAGSKLLIPGNITVASENKLAETAPDCDILKAPRHANKASCSEALLNASTPEAVIVSTERALSADFSERLSEYNVYSTKINGDITVKCDNPCKILPYKKVSK